jgi:hypothetical protein
MLSPEKDRVWDEWDPKNQRSEKFNLYIGSDAGWCRRLMIQTPDLCPSLDPKPNVLAPHYMYCKLCSPTPNYNSHQPLNPYSLLLLPALWQAG